MANPVIFTAAGQAHTAGCRVNAVIWEGATTVGDTATVSSIATGTVIWPGRTNDTNTYIGANFGQNGIACPDGFRCSKLSSGTLYVYLKEE